jgi:Flp pilus assembly protein TadB
VSTIEDADDWRRRAERERREKVRRLNEQARRRLRRMERAARARLAVEGPAARSDRVVLDSERYAAPLSERLDARDRVQVVLWGAMLIVLAVAIVSFFTEPLMDLDTAIAGVTVTMMLVLSYLM